MLIIALVLAVIGLAALVTAVVTSNELIAWVCIGASAVGVVLLIVDALRDRARPDESEPTADGTAEADQFDADYPEDAEPATNTGSGSESDTAVIAEEDAGTDPDADTRAVPYDERHEDRPTS